MKKHLQASKFAANTYLLLSGVSLLFVLLCGFLGFSLLNAQHTRELNSYGNIAGAILSEYPDAEQTLVSAMQDTQYKNLDEGFLFLEKYGYRKNLLMTDEPYYRQSLRAFFSLLGLVFLLFFILITFSFIRFSASQKKQERRLHELLEGCLAENYSVLADKEAFVPIFNEAFTDTLFKLEHKLMAKTRALNEERDNTKTLVTDISHQLKTPVSALKSCFAMCMEADSEEERTDFLERCAAKLDNLEALLTVLVNVSRLENAMITLRPETVALSDILTDAVNTVYEKALQKEIAIDIAIPDETDASKISLYLDRKWSAEAIANLLDNAVKYSPRQSTVTLRLHTFYSHIRLEIEDEGIGIPKSEFNHIFKRFHRGSHPLVRQSEGAGVGLYLARRIIEEQNGAVFVKNAAKQGSIFQVRLPLRAFL